MLKSLYPKISWDEVAIIGFDMDGTLYDEVDFISQVYRPIAINLTNVIDKEPNIIYSWMLSRWLEKGSSYNHIFEEVLSEVNLKKDHERIIINECLEIFREYKPKIHLSEWVEILLNEIGKSFDLFLVSDGPGKLQTRKFESLDLGRWIMKKNIGITGNYGAEFYKPSIKIIEKIEILGDGDFEGRVVYFGDRDIDEEFSRQAGFSFVRVNCMKPLAKRDIS